MRCAPWLALDVSGNMHIIGDDVEVTMTAGGCTCTLKACPSCGRQHQVILPQDVTVEDWRVLVYEGHNQPPDPAEITLTGPSGKTHRWAGNSPTSPRVFRTVCSRPLFEDDGVKETPYGEIPPGQLCCGGCWK